jgi:hypothetical protein
MRFLWRRLQTLCYFIMNCMSDCEAGVSDVIPAELFHSSNARFGTWEAGSGESREQR